MKDEIINVFSTDLKDVLADMYHELVFGKRKEVTKFSLHVNTKDLNAIMKFFEDTAYVISNISMYNATSFEISIIRHAETKNNTRLYLLKDEESNNLAFFAAAEEMGNKESMRVFGDENIVSELTSKLGTENYRTTKENKYFYLIEKITLRQRQQEGMDLARRRGVHFGPQKAEIPDGFEEIYLKWNHGKITANMAMQKLGMKRSSFYRMAHRYESNHSTANKEERQEIKIANKKLDTVYCTKYSTVKVIDKIVTDNLKNKLPLRYTISPTIVDKVKEFFDNSLIIITEDEFTSSNLKRRIMYANPVNTPSKDMVITSLHNNKIYLNEAISKGFSKFRIVIPDNNRDIVDKTIYGIRRDWLREVNITKANKSFVEFELKPNNDAFYCLDFRGEGLLALLLDFAFKTDNFKARIYSALYLNAEVETFFKDSMWNVATEKTDTDGTMIITVSKSDKTPIGAALYKSAEDLGVLFDRGYTPVSRNCIFRFIQCNKESLAMKTINAFYSHVQITKSLYNNYTEVKCIFDDSVEHENAKEYIYMAPNNKDDDTKEYESINAAVPCGSTLDNTTTDVCRGDEETAIVNNKETLITPQEAHKLVENSRGNMIKLLNAAINNAITDGKFNTTVSTELLGNYKCAIELLHENGYTYSVSEDEKDIHIQW